MICVSVIVPTYNAADRLRRCLAAIAKSSAASWEVIVVDDGSRDSSGAVLAESGVRTIRHQSNRGVSAARNSGAKEAQGEYLVFVDADVIVEPDTIHKLVDRLLRDPAVAATGARPSGQSLDSGCGAEYVALRAAWPFEALGAREVAPFSSFQSECGAIRASVFRAIGGFDTKYVGVGMEEFDLGHRLEAQGYMNVLLADAVYHHACKRFWRRCLELARRTRLWVPLFLRRNRFESEGAVGTKRESLSCALSVLGLGCLVVGLVSVAFFAMGAVLLAVQGFIERGFLGAAFRRGGLKLLCYSALALQAMHVAIGFGFVWGLLERVPGVGNGRGCRLGVR